VEKSSVEIIKKMSLPIFWEIIRQKTIMIWCLILYNPIMARNMSLKVHFLDSYLDFFQENQGSQQYAQTAISPGHFHHGKVVPWQVESQYAG
jgi:hypothetical protein